MHQNKTPDLFAANRKDVFYENLEQPFWTERREKKRLRRKTKKCQAERIHLLHQKKNYDE